MLTTIPKEVERIQECIRKLSLLYFSLAYYDADAKPLPKTHDRKRTIDSFNAAECKIMFGFSSEQLTDLLVLFHLPAFVIFPGGSKMPGEEVLLRGLYELVSGEKGGPEVSSRDDC